MSKQINLDSYNMEFLDFMKNKQIVCSIQSVSRSGMTRKMDFYFISDNQLIYCNKIIAEIAGYKRDKKGSLIVSGCGMDMIFSVLYNFNISMLKLKGFTMKDHSHSENCKFWIDSSNYRLV